MVGVLLDEVPSPRGMTLGLALVSIMVQRATFGRIYEMVADEKRHVHGFGTAPPPALAPT